MTRRRRRRHTSQVRPVHRGAVASLAALCLIIGSSQAQTPPVLSVPTGGTLPGGAAPSANTTTPALISADQISYDDALDVIIASGHVELTQEARTLIADAVTYNKKTNIVTASGNVRVIEPNGDVFFSEYLELTDNLKTGFVDGIRILLSDNSRIVGAAAERTDNGRFIRINRAIYSPCNLCVDDPTQAPSYQVRAARITHDRETKDVTYRDAQIEILGFPILYSPYFTHPDPTVDRRSGFLSPVFGSTASLGTIFRGYYYFDISPDMDATLETTWSEKDGPLIGGEIRKRFSFGQVELQGSAVYAERIENVNGLMTIKNPDFRYHFFGKGVFNLTDIFRAGFNVQTASDNTYLRRYSYFNDDILISRGFFEGFMNRSYAAINAYSFQDLRPKQVDPNPIVVPQIYGSWIGDPGSLLNGRASMEASFVRLSRPRGPDYDRLSVVPGWAGSWIHSSGLVAGIRTQLRAEYFRYSSNYSQNIPELYNTTDGDAWRVIPVGEASLRYPLVTQIGSTQTIIEPTVAITAAGRIGKDPLDNEDSRAIEFSDRNLFSLNRFSGVDRYETGTRLTYGAQTSFVGFGGGSTSIFLGQSYRLTGPQDFVTLTGLGSRQSDFVARANINPSRYVSLEYAAAISSDSLVLRRQQLFGTAGVPALSASAQYTYYQDLSIAGQTRQGTPIFGERDEYLAISLSSKLSDYWSISLVQSRDLSNFGRGILSNSGVLTYADECLTVQFIGTDSQISTSDLSAGTTFYVRLVLRNIGEISTPKINANFLTGADVSAGSSK